MSAQRRYFGPFLASGPRSSRRPDWRTSGHSPGGARALAESQPRREPDVRGARAAENGGESARPPVDDRGEYPRDDHDRRHQPRRRSDGAFVGHRQSEGTVGRHHGADADQEDGHPAHGANLTWLAEARCLPASTVRRQPPCGSEANGPERQSDRRRAAACAGAGRMPTGRAPSWRDGHDSVDGRSQPQPGPGPADAAYRRGCRPADGGANGL